MLHFPKITMAVAGIFYLITWRVELCGIALTLLLMIIFIFKTLKNTIFDSN